MASVAQAHREFALNGHFDVHVVRTHMPRGGGRIRYGQGPRGVDLGRWRKNSKSVVRIYHRDGMCAARAIVVGLAHVRGDPLFANQKIYNPSKGSPSLPIQTERARALHLVAGVPLLACTLEEIAQFQTYLAPQGIQLNVVSRSHFNSLVYTGEVREVVHHLYLYYAEGHYDYVTKVHRVLGHTYFSETCNKGYSSRQNPCHGLCRSCGLVGCSLPLLRLLEGNVIPTRRDVEEDFVAGDGLGRSIVAPLAHGQGSVGVGHGEEVNALVGTDRGGKPSRDASPRSWKPSSTPPAIPGATSTSTSTPAPPTTAAPHPRAQSPSHSGLLSGGGPHPRGTRGKRKNDKTKPDLEDSTLPPDVRMQRYAQLYNEYRAMGRLAQLPGASKAAQAPPPQPTAAATPLPEPEPEPNLDLPVPPPETPRKRPRSLTPLLTKKMGKRQPMRKAKAGPNLGPSPPSTLPDLAESLAQLRRKKMKPILKAVKKWSRYRNNNNNNKTKTKTLLS
ncbi:predicted protein [Nematostella vectensis]|uniref:Uncharacterized protein n=1 Tax=Nematostella vectensis TaxID=45351 RepID=A7T474_NEMVE|nr:predicted protein [Nematostella vectensis]|eukprot:XP_001621339.1 hypothetical protein NEMVEDRAFT_v1g222086 [Nematostella vectensis]